MEAIKQAILNLRNHDVIGLPTETVYGLAAAIDSPKGIDKIFALKERPFFDPLIIHIASVEQAKSCAGEWNDKFQKLADKFWPGPLTLIVPKNDRISSKITSGLNTVGLRMPNHPLALELIKELGVPVAAPSANKFTKTSPTKYSHVKKSFPETLVLDGGDCKVGIESTILGFEDYKPVIYRPGMITPEDLGQCLGEEVLIKESPVAPGHLKHHYMPDTPLIAINKDLDLNQQQIPAPLLKSYKSWCLDVDANQAARSLYQNLRDYDHVSSSAIVLFFTKSQYEDNMFTGIFNRISKAADYFIID